MNPEHGKITKLPRGGGGRNRGGGKLQKRVVGVPISASKQSRRPIVTTSQVIKQETHEPSRRIVEERKIEMYQEEPARNFNVEEWIHEPVDKMETDNRMFHVSEDDTSESDDDDDDDGVGNQGGFEMENGESSGYGIANTESRWGGTQISDDEGFEHVGDDEEILNDGRNFKVEDSDSDSFGSDEYSD